MARIQNSQGLWLADERDIATEAVEHFQNQFKQDRDATSFPLLSHILELISDGENTCLGVIPDGEEVKKVVFRLNGDSSNGSDGLTGRLFQVCWDIV